MTSHNQVTLIGNLGSQPEGFLTRSTSQGCRFRLCTNEAWMDKSGARRERPQWHRIVGFGSVADTCLERLRSGSFVRIEGRIEYASYVDKEQVRRQSTQIVALDVQLLDRGSNDNDNETKPKTTEVQGESAA